MVVGTEVGNASEDPAAEVASVGDLRDAEDGAAAFELRGGDDDGAVEGEDAGEEAAAEARTSISTFMPAEQCPWIPQMKYRFPAAVSLTTVLPPESVEIGLLVAQVA